MGDDEVQRIDTWEQIDDAIAQKIEARLVLEMLDQPRAALRARELAGDAVRVICSMVGGGEVYIPRLARHHREERDAQLRMNFNGDCAAAAKTAPSPLLDRPHLSVRQTRRIVEAK